MNLFQNSNNKMSRLASLCFLLLAVSVAMLGFSSKRSGNSKEISLRGHVIANVYGLSDYFLVGEPGFNAKDFIFLVDSPNEQKPVRISYQFFKQEPRLPGPFFSYSTIYELRVTRDPSCDVTVEHLSHMKNEEAGTGKPLPPTNVLHILDGAPKDVLKPEALLPCYVLKPGKYKVVSRGVDTK